MSETMSSMIYITFLEREGSYIKIWGQTDKILPIGLEKALKQMTPQFEQGQSILTPDGYQSGMMCCAKFKDGSYYRARITNTLFMNQGIVEVIFVDYGNRDYVPLSNLRSMHNFTASLISIPAQAREFILGGVTHPGPAWDDSIFELISSEMRYLDLEFQIIGQVGNYVMITLSHSMQDVATSLVARGYVVPVPFPVQQVTLQNMSAKLAPIPRSISSEMMMIPKNPAPGLKLLAPLSMAPMPSPMVQPTILAYKSLPLEQGSEHAVYVSYVTDGPLLFSVQLQKMEDKLKQLMTEINTIPLQLLDEPPLPGCVCMARSTEDEYICRAVVTSMVDGNFKVFYVDFGNTEVLPFMKLYQIPFKYVIPKVMATRFALSGLNNSVVSLDMKCAFKEFVNNKILFMRVVPPVKGTAVNLCDLWDETKTSALDYVKCSALQSYPDAVPLSRGFNQDVKVSFVFSCKRFYVQLKNKEDELNGLMQRLQEVCAQKPVIDPAMLQDGTPCNALYESDGMFYRAQIIELHGAMVKVRYVDYGNEEMVTVECVRQPDVDLITVLRPQAIECCLSGYQNMGDDQERDDLFEELILEQDFSMKVVEIQGGKTLVDLFDAQHYNVASLLLEKIAAKRSQVSPALVQDNSKIEHRKRTPPEGYSKRSPRESNERGFNNKKDSWRDKSRNRSEEEPRSDWRETKSNRDDQRDERNKRYDSNRNRNEQSDNGWGNNAKSPDYNSDSIRKPRNDTGWKRDSVKSPEPASDFIRKPRNEDAWGSGSMKSPDPPSDFKRKPRYEGSRNDGGWGGHSGRSPERSSDYSKRRPRNEGYNSDYNRNKKGDGSEKSWSESEKGGTHIQNRGEKRPPRQNQNFDSNRGSGRRNDSSKSSWNNEAPLEVLSFAGPGDEFSKADHTGKTEDVTISWFYNPNNFYCKLGCSKAEFAAMMNEIQTSYKKRKPSEAPVGAPVVAMFPEDNALYRATIIEVTGALYKVFFVDFGNYSTTKKVYPIERKHMELAVQAYCCAIDGIFPNGDNWPDSNAFGKYFEKDNFQCTFVNIDEEKYNVNLLHQGVSIRDQLVGDGLAVEKSAEPSTEDLVSLDILLHQKISCQLASVNKLSDILLQVQPGTFVQCSLHNLDKATEILEANLQKYLGLFVIASVDKIVGDRLEVTLYDGGGIKLEAFTPDASAPGTISPILQLPIISTTLTGLVTHATDTKIFLQPSAMAESVAYLLDALYECYETSDEIPETAAVDEVYAVHSADGNWYRGRVASVENEMVAVIFLDYGNEETVEKLALRELDPLHYEPHLLAVEIQFKNGESVIEQEITVNLTKRGEAWEGQLITQALESGQEVTANVAQEPISEQTSNDVVAPLEDVEYPSSQFGFSVILSHLDNPGQFYLQVLEAEDPINELQDRLQAEIPQLPDIENVTTGILCAAQYSVDQLWYRAQVLDSDPDITTVRFVDFGNTDVLDNTTSKVKTLPSELLSLEHHSKRCSLYLKPVDIEWSTEACEKFELLTGDKLLTAEIIHQDEKTTFVDLYAESVNIGQELLKDKMALELQLETSASCTGFVSNLNSPSEFWIQLESACNDLEWVADQLTNADDYPQLQDLEPGSLCAAVFPDDSSWYRARILSNTVAGLEVLFVDYGNSCTCRSLRELPEDLVMLPPLAQKCSLQKPPGLLQWPPAASNTFKEISADGITIFTVNKLSQGETSIVQLIHEGIDISTKLLPETLNAVITDYNSVGDFSIKGTDNESLAEHCKLDSLPGYIWGDETEEKLKEINNEGQTIFQVEMVSQNVVRLYLNDSDIRSNLPLVKCSPVSSVQNTPKKICENTKTEIVLSSEEPPIMIEVNSAEANPEFNNKEQIPDVSKTNAVKIETNEQTVTDQNVSSKYGVPEEEKSDKFITCDSPIKEDLNVTNSSTALCEEINLIDSEAVEIIETEETDLMESPRHSALEIMNEICDNVESKTADLMRSPQHSAMEIMNEICDNVEGKGMKSPQHSAMEIMNEICDNVEGKGMKSPQHSAMEIMNEICDNVEGKVSFDISKPETKTVQKSHEDEVIICTIKQDTGAIESSNSVKIETGKNGADSAIKIMSEICDKVEETVSAIKPITDETNVSSLIEAEDNTVSVTNIMNEIFDNVEKKVSITRQSDEINTIHSKKALENVDSIAVIEQDSGLTSVSDTSKESESNGMEILEVKQMQNVNSDIPSKIDTSKNAGSNLPVSEITKAKGEHSEELGKEKSAGIVDPESIKMEIS